MSAGQFFNNAPDRGNKREEEYHCNEKTDGTEYDDYEDQPVVPYDGGPGPPMGQYPPSHAHGMEMMPYDNGTTFNKAGKVQMGNRYYGPVTFVTYLPPTTPDMTRDPLQKKNDSKAADEDIRNQIASLDKLYGEEALPEDVRQKLESLRTDIRQLRDENGELEIEVDNNARKIEAALTQREHRTEEFNSETQDKRLQDLRTFMLLVGDEDAYEVKQIMHMIDAQDIAGLQEILQDEVKRMFGIHECDDLNHDTSVKGIGDPDTLPQRLAQLRKLIMAALDENDTEVKIALRMIDNNDISGLKMILTQDVKRRFGLMDDDDTKTSPLDDSGLHVPLDQETSANKKKKRAMKDLERLVRAIRSGSSEEIQEVAKKVTGDGDRVRAMLAGERQVDYSSFPDNETELMGDDPTVTEVQVQQGRGHIKTIKTQNSAEPVTGVIFMPGLKWICVTHFKSSRVWIYNEDGITLGSFVLAKMKNPSGLVALKSKANTIAIADFHNKRIHLVTLSLSSDNHLDTENHNIWKLLFQPADVANFQMNMLLIASMHDDAVSIFTEEGKHVGNIKIQGYAIGKLYSAVGTSTEIVIVDCNDDDSAIVWLTLAGQVIRCYSGKKEGEQSMEDPLHVLQDDKGLVVIADHDNNRVHLLDKDGKFQQFLLQRGDGVQKPRRFHMDMSGPSPRLFLGCGAVGDVQVRIYDYHALCSTLFDFDADVEEPAT